MESNNGNYGQPVPRIVSCRLLQHLLRTAVETQVSSGVTPSLTTVDIEELHSYLPFCSDEGEWLDWYKLYKECDVYRIVYGDVCCMIAFLLRCIMGNRHRGGVILHAFSNLENIVGSSTAVWSELRRTFPLASVVPTRLQPFVRWPISRLQEAGSTYYRVQISLTVHALRALYESCRDNRVVCGIMCDTDNVYLLMSTQPQWHGPGYQYSLYEERLLSILRKRAGYFKCQEPEELIHVVVDTLLADVTLDIAEQLQLGMVQRGIIRQAHFVILLWMLGIPSVHYGVLIDENLKPSNEGTYPRHAAPSGHCGWVQGQHMARDCTTKFNFFSRQVRHITSDRENVDGAMSVLNDTLIGVVVERDELGCDVLQLFFSQRVPSPSQSQRVPTAKPIQESFPVDDQLEDENSIDIPSGVNVYSPLLPMVPHLLSRRYTSKRRAVGKPDRVHLPDTESSSSSSQDQLSSYSDAGTGHSNALAFVVINVYNVDGVRLGMLFIPASKNWQYALNQIRQELEQTIKNDRSIRSDGWTMMLGDAYSQLTPITLSLQLPQTNQVNVVITSRSIDRRNSQWTMQHDQLTFRP